MKIGIIRASQYLRSDIDLFDVYPYFETFDCCKFSSDLKLAEATCDQVFIYSTCVGILPAEYQTIPITENHLINNDAVNYSSRHSLINTIISYIPHCSAESIELHIIGDMPTHITRYTD